MRVIDGKRLLTEATWVRLEPSDYQQMPHRCDFVANSGRLGTTSWKAPYKSTGREFADTWVPRKNRAYVAFVCSCGPSTVPVRQLFVVAGLRGGALGGRRHRQRGIECDQVSPPANSCRMGVAGCCYLQTVAAWVRLGVASCKQLLHGRDYFGAPKYRRALDLWLCRGPFFGSYPSGNCLQRNRTYVATVCSAPRSILPCDSCLQRTTPKCPCGNCLGRILVLGVVTLSAICTRGCRQGAFWLAAVVGNALWTRG